MNNMNHKNKALYSIFIGIAIVAGIVLGQTLNFNQKNNLSFQHTEKDKIDNLLRYINDEYVDAVNTDSIVDAVVYDIMKNLDPHSVYIPKKDVAEADEELEGEFVGIGVLFQQYKDTFTVIRPLDNSPAKRAGIKAMDRILMVEKDTLFGKNIDISDISKKIKGKLKTKVSLTVYRKTIDSVFSINITRDEIPILSVPAHYMVNDSIGFIKIKTFSATTYNEFDSAIKDLKIRGMKTLILDLRDNTGGLLKQADLIADEFLPNGKLIFFTKDKTGDIKKVAATARGRFEKGKIFVLINENSASASEIVAGALQDNDKAVIVGRRSFGKGLVQREMQLGDGSKVRLVVARYYTPTGRCIQRPYKKGDKKAYEQDFQDRQYNGELYYKDSIPVIDSLKFTTPKGKIVYGGGGIIPDIFVSLKTNDYMYKYRVLNQFLSNSITDYLDKHLFELSKMTENEFVANNDIATKLYKAFKNNHNQKINPHNKHRSKKGKENLKRVMKALLARDLFGTNAYYRILNQEDAMIQKVFEIEKENTHVTVE